MTTPQQQPEAFESTERTGSLAHNADAAGAAGSRTDTSYPAEGTGASAQNAEAAKPAGSSYETRHAAERTNPSTTHHSTGRPDPSTETTGAEADSSTTGTESSAHRTGTAPRESLFAEHEHSSLRSRWADVQAGFVDDPRECVQKADRLVADLVDHLTAGFAEARSRLEEQWARGEEVSTENLRVALKRYRDFFERLLTV